MGWSRGIFGSAKKSPRQQCSALSFLVRALNAIIGSAQDSPVIDGDLQSDEVPISLLVAPISGAFDSNLADIVAFSERGKGVS